jgi:hypothetical protein
VRFFRTAVLLLIAVAAFAVTSTAGAADNGSVSIVPASSDVPTGGTVDIDVIIDPPSIGTSIWIVHVYYDPSVVQYVSCTPMANPGGGIAFASACDNATPHGVTFGGWVENQGGTPHGFETPQVAGTFTFTAIGAPGSQSPLSIIVQAMLGPNGEVEAPQTHNGVINVVAAPVGGTVEILSATGTGGTGVWWAAAQTAVVLLLALGGTAVGYRRVRR